MHLKTCLNVARHRLAKSISLAVRKNGKSLTLLVLTWKMYQPPVLIRVRLMHQEHQTEHRGNQSKP